jgi:tetratricopeptide (TPR) repeat protein
LFKAQLHALAFEHWSAGRTAKAGKRDLDLVLARDPDNDDAIMVVGTYMYFADSLPRVLRLASLLLRIPGGDRKRGIEWLGKAGRGDGYTRDDARGMLGGALFGFEGALEDALPIFEGLSRDYPENPRLLEPVALLELFFPERTGAALPRMRAAVEIGERSSDPRIRNLGARVRFYEALTEVLSGEVDLARENLETLHAVRPEEPDWFAADIYRNLADIYLLLGEGARAKALHAELDPNDSKDQLIEELLRFLRDEEGGPDAAVASASEVELLRAVQPAARALSKRDLPEASRILDSLPGEDAIVAFYRAELEVLSGRPNAAIPHYRKLDRDDLPERMRLFRYVARLRLAQVIAESGDYEHSAEVLQRAIESFELRDLMRHVTKARRRYFENRRGSEVAPTGTSLSRGSRISEP